MLKYFMATITFLVGAWILPASAAELAGLVESSNGARLIGYPVVVFDQSGRYLTVFTDSQGQFHVYQLSAGIYRISAQGQNKMLATVNIESANAKATAPTITLAPAN